MALTKQEFLLACLKEGFLLAKTKLHIGSFKIKFLKLPFSLIVSLKKRLSIG